MSSNVRSPSQLQLRLALDGSSLCLTSSWTLGRMLNLRLSGCDYTTLAEVSTTGT